MSAEHRIRALLGRWETTLTLRPWSLEVHPLDPYSRDGWNLNNLPILAGSLLRYVKSDTRDSSACREEIERTLCQANVENTIPT
jgi:hypothetical protein